MSEHAMLSASGASRWLVCTPSARLEETLDEVESVYADEGTLAHDIAKHMILYKLKRYSSEGAYKDTMTRFKEDELFNEEMLEYLDEYSSFVVAKYKSDSRNLIFLEQKLELEEYIPEGFGTVDVMIINPDLLQVIDYKHGKGVPVDAVENSQTKVYSLGALKEFDFFFDKVKTIQMTIYQPRIENISTFEISTQELLLWAEEVLKPTALIAFNGLGEYVPGSHCKFCRAKPTCKAHAVYNLQLAAQEFAVPTVVNPTPANLITDEQVSKILLRAKRMKEWITSVEEYALREALGGKKWPGLKLVSGRSSRKYGDEKQIMKNLLAAGIEEEKVVNKKLPGIIELSKNISKLDFKKYVEPHIVKPDGSPALVSEKDKRPERNSDTAAALDFKTN